MDLIIGGAYQGKLDYARERFHLEAEDLAFYENGYDTTRRCLCYLEQAVYDAVAAGRPFELPPLRADAVVICTDVSCGVVPMDRVQRLWREEVGRTACALARRGEKCPRPCKASGAFPSGASGHRGVPHLFSGHLEGAGSP